MNIANGGRKMVIYDRDKRIKYYGKKVFIDGKKAILLDRKIKTWRFDKYLNRVKGIYQNKEDRQDLVITSWTDGEILFI